VGDLVRHGRVRRAYTGIAAQQFTLSRRRRHAARLAQETAVMIATVEPGSPAARAGLVAGDIILALDGTAVTGADDLIRNLAGDKIGRRVEIEALRSGSRHVVSLEPRERPPPRDHTRGGRGGRRGGGGGCPPPQPPHPGGPNRREEEAKKAPPANHPQRRGRPPPPPRRPVCKHTSERPQRQPQRGSERD